jgi:hypothetical protein
MPEFRQVVFQGRTYTVDEDGTVQPAPGVDMEEYDRKLMEMGFVFEDDPEDEDEDEVTLTFLAEPEAPTKP